MTIDEYRRGIPTYKGENGQTVGMLCETKEQCITDDDGVSLPDKLEGLKKYTDDAYANSNLYTDTKIGELINGAPTTLDTLKEIADAMEENADVVEALDKAVGSKVDQAEYDGHADNDTIHVTAAEKEAWSKNGGEEIQAIINGTTTVGNANKVNGLTLYKSFGEIGGTVSQNTPILDLVKAMSNNSVLVATVYNPTSGIYPSLNGVVEINKTGTGQHTTLKFIERTGDKTEGMWFGVAQDTSNYWSGWHGNATTADLVNKLDKSGGTVTSPYGTVMTLRSTAGNEVVMQYRNSADDNEGSLGFNGIDNPIFKKTDGTNLQLLHTGSDVAMFARGITPAASLDTVRANGAYYVSPDSTDRPGAYGQMLVMHNADTIGQLYIIHAPDKEGMKFRGGSYAGGFYPWKTVIDDSNVGDYALPLNNATKPTVTTKNNDVIVFNNTQDNAQHIWLELHIANQGVGAFGFNVDKEPLVWVNSASKKILHTGNSAKCVVVDTDPGVGASVSYADGTLIFVKE